MSFTNDMKDPNQIVMTDDTGKTGTISKDDVEAAKAQGYHPATQEEIQERLNKESYGEGAANGLAATALGIARGASFGASDYLLTRNPFAEGGLYTPGNGLINPETVQKLQQYNPGLSMAGEIGGAIIPSLLGGEGAIPEEAGNLAKGIARTRQALNIAAAPVKAVTATGRAIEDAVLGLGERTLGEHVADGLGKKALETVAKMSGAAAEGAAYGAATPVTEDALGEKPLNAEALMSNAGMGALFGATIPTFAGGFSMAASHIGSKANESLQNLGGLIGKTLQETGDWINKSKLPIKGMLAGAAIGGVAGAVLPDHTALGGAVAGAIGGGAIESIAGAQGPGLFSMGASGAGSLIGGAAGLATGIPGGAIGGAAIGSAAGKTIGSAVGSGIGLVKKGLTSLHVPGYLAGAAAGAGTGALLGAATGGNVGLDALAGAGLGAGLGYYSGVKGYALLSSLYTEGLDRETIERAVGGFNTPEGRATRKLLNENDTALLARATDWKDQLESTINNMADYRHDLETQINKEVNKSFDAKLTPQEAERGVSNNLPSEFSDESMGQPEGGVSNQGFAKGQPFNIINDIHNLQIPRIASVGTPETTELAEDLYQKNVGVGIDYLQELIDNYGTKLGSATPSANEYSKVKSFIADRIAPIIQKGIPDLVNVGEKAFLKPLPVIGGAADWLWDAGGATDWVWDAVKDTKIGAKLAEWGVKGPQDLSGWMKVWARNNPSIGDKYQKQLMILMQDAQDKMEGIASRASNDANTAQKAWDKQGFDLKDSPRLMMLRGLKENLGLDLDKEDDLQQLFDYGGGMGGKLNGTKTLEKNAPDLAQPDYIEGHKAFTKIPEIDPERGDSSHISDWLSDEGRDFITKHGGIDKVVLKIDKSSHGYGVFLHLDKDLPEYVTKMIEENPHNVLLQQKLDLAQEFRTYTAGDQPFHNVYRFGTDFVKTIKNMFIKSTKDLDDKNYSTSRFENDLKTRVREIGENLQEVKDPAMVERLEAFAKKASRALPSYLNAFDIGLTRDNELVLIEAQDHFGRRNPFMMKKLKSIISDDIMEKQADLDPYLEHATKTSDVLKSVQDHLGDDALYGEKAKEYQSLYKVLYPHERVTTELLNQLGKAPDLSKPIGELIDDSTPITSKSSQGIDVEKLKKYLLALGSPGDKEVEKTSLLIKDFLKRSQDLQTEAKNRILPEVSMEGYQKFTGQIGDVKARAQLNAFAKKSPILNDLLVTGAAYHFLGGWTAPFIGAGKLVGNPVLAMKGMMTIEKAVDIYNKDILKSVGNFFKKASSLKVGNDAGDWLSRKSITPPTTLSEKMDEERKTKTSIVVPATVISLQSHPFTVIPPEKKQDESTAQKAFLARSKEITDLISNPTKLTENLSSSLQGVATFAPQHGQLMAQKAMTALNFLYDKMPKAPSTYSPFGGRQWTPTDLEINKWGKYLEAVNNPLSVVESFSKGNVSNEGIEVLRTLYPETSKTVDSQIMDHLSNLKEPLPLQKRIQLSKMLGFPVDDSMKPDFINSMQQINNVQQQQQQDKQQTESKPVKLDTAKAKMTDTQRLQFQSPGSKQEK